MGESLFCALQLAVVTGLLPEDKSREFEGASWDCCEIVVAAVVFVAADRGVVGLSIGVEAEGTLDEVSLSLISFSLLSFFNEDEEDSERSEEEDFFSCCFLEFLSWLLDRPS